MRRSLLRRDLNSPFHKSGYRPTGRTGDLAAHSRSFWEENRRGTTAKTSAEQTADAFAALAVKLAMNESADLPVLSVLAVRKVRPEPVRQGLSFVAAEHYLCRGGASRPPIALSMASAR